MKFKFKFRISRPLEKSEWRQHGLSGHADLAVLDLADDPAAVANPQLP